MAYRHPADILLPYQADYVRLGREEKFLFVLQSRQTGKSFMLAAEAVEDSWTRGPTNWICLSSGERAAEEWLLKAEKYCRWVKAFDPRLTYTYKSSEIRLANGSRIIAIPAKPETARGYTGNLILDEFSAHESQEEIWAATYPFITNPLSGDKKLRIAGTPIGKANWFWEVWKNNPKFRKVRNDIYQCRDKGLKVDIDAIREGLGDDDIFRQEYLLEPMESNTALLSEELVDKATYDRLPPIVKPVTCLGIDIGRYRDRTAIVTLVVDTALPKPCLYMTDLKVLAGTEYVVQEKAISDEIREKSPSAVGVDAAGIGSELAENLQREYGGLIQSYVASNQSKVDGWNAVKRLMSQDRLKIPRDKALRKELLDIRRVVTQNGMRYEFARSRDGHGDIASGLQIATTAAIPYTEFDTFLPIAF